MITATKILENQAYRGQPATASLNTVDSNGRLGYRWTDFRMVNDHVGGWPLLPRWYATRKAAVAAAERIGATVDGYAPSPAAVALGSMRSSRKAAASRANLAGHGYVPPRKPRCPACAGKPRRCSACVAASL